MKKTDFSRHTIADLRDWDTAERLEIQPDFQRNYVWSSPARIMLIDSILENIPLPKIYIASTIKKGQTHRIVIDGQQRITSILDFLSDAFALDAPYSGIHIGKRFSDLPDEVQDQFLSYRLDFNEFENYSDPEMREVYNRVNKYTAALTKQELRRADFPGEFLTLSESLAVLDFFDDAKLFTPANRRRLSDVEYTSELLAVILEGPRDKKATLDDFYTKYSIWAEKEMTACENIFLQIVENITQIFPMNYFPIKSTRFKQKSDFYSLFAAIHSILQKGSSLNSDLIPSLVEDLRLIDYWVSPGEPNKFGEYATRCVSDANSRSSRMWRRDFILNFLEGAYKPDGVTNERIKLFNELLNDMSYGEGLCPMPTYTCNHCNKEEVYDPDKWTFAFPKGRVFLSTAIEVHKNCVPGLSEDILSLTDE